MNNLLIGLLLILTATNHALAASNFVAETTGTSVNIPDPNDPVEQAYQKLLADDDAAQGEADRMMRENDALKSRGVAITEFELQGRIARRLEPVRKEYEEFLQRHPNHARARLAYGSFLGDIGEEQKSVEQWEKSKDLDPKNPAVWNNLANYYGHRGPVTNAFLYYEKAIELNPNEAVYYHNLGTTLYLFRVDAKRLYGINEQQVFDRALEMYAKAIKLDPDNFVLAQDVAQTYYGIKPPRYKEALAAWNYALKLAKDDAQREGIYIHLARTKISMGLFDEARVHLNAVTNQVYLNLKERLQKNLAQKEAKAKGTNAVPTLAPDSTKVSSQ